MAQFVTTPSWEQSWTSPTTRSRPTTPQQQLVLANRSTLPRRSTSPRREQGGVHLATLNGLPMVSSGERRATPGPPSVRGDIERPFHGCGGAVFDLVNAKTTEVVFESSKHLQGLVHGVGLSLDLGTAKQLLHVEAQEDAGPPVRLEISHKRRRAKHIEPARKWHRNSAIGIDKDGKGVARQHEGDAGDTRRRNTEEWTLIVRAADGRPLGDSVLRIEFHLPEDVFHGYLPKTAAARAGEVEQQKPMVVLDKEPYELRIIGWRAITVGIVAHKVPPDHRPVVAAYLRSPEGLRWAKTSVGIQWATETPEGQEWAAAVAAEEKALKDAAAEAEMAGVRNAEEALAAALAAVEAACTEAEKEAAMIKLDGAKRKLKKEKKKLEKAQGADQAFLDGWNAANEQHGGKSDSAWSFGMHAPEPEPEVKPELTGPTQVNFLANELRLSRIQSGDGDSDDEERTMTMMYGERMTLTVTNIAGKVFTVEVRKNDTMEELVENIRDAEQQMLLEAEETGGSWEGGSWWEKPLLMFGDVELQTIQTRQIPGNQTMDFVLKLGLDYPNIVDGSALYLEVPPHPPPDPPPLQSWRTQHTLVGKLEGTQRKEHRLLVWEDQIEEVDGLDVDPAETGAPAVLEIKDIKLEGAESPSAVALRRQVFDMLDTEKTGVLGREQVRRLVQEIDGTELSDEDLDAAMAVMDDDCNGAVDFQEFSAWWIMRTEQDVENEEDESDEDDDDFEQHTNEQENDEQENE